VHCKIELLGQAPPGVLVSGNRKTTKGGHPMSQESHLAELERKHRALDQEIQSERLSRNSDTLRLTSMKREKLHLKDEIEKLKAKLVSKTLH
jgi:hypothetical protein